MNKSYRSIWNEKAGTFVAVAETAMARGKRSGSVERAQTDGLTASPQITNAAQKGFFATAAGMGATVALMFGASSAWAAGPVVTVCGSGGNYGMYATTNGAVNATVCGGAEGLGSFTGAMLADNDTAPTSWIAAGSGGIVTVGANTKIQMNQYVDMTTHSITNLSTGNVSATSSDAINGSQLFSMSNSLSTAVSSTSLAVPLTRALLPPPRWRWFRTSTRTRPCPSAWAVPRIRVMRLRPSR